MSSSSLSLSPVHSPSQSTIPDSPRPSSLLPCLRRPGASPAKPDPGCEHADPGIEDSRLNRVSATSELQSSSLELTRRPPSQHVEALEVLLHGLCGVPKERLRVHELCLKSGTNLGVVPSEVRLLCDLAQNTPSWTVRHVGGAMRGTGAEQISVLVRTVVESQVSNSVLRFFYALGYKLDHELLKVGFAFRFQRGAQITVTVTSANKMLKLHSVDEAVPVTPGIQMVEITAPAAADNYSEVGSAVSSFCEYLAPLLHLSKPGVSTGIAPTAAAAATSLMSNSGGKAL